MEKLSEYMFSSSWSHTSTVRAPCRQLSGPLFGMNHSQIDGSTSGSWSKFLSMGTSSKTLSTDIISGICTARSIYCEYSQYLDVVLIFHPERQKKKKSGI